MSYNTELIQTFHITLGMFLNLQSLQKMRMYKQLYITSASLFLSKKYFVNCTNNFVHLCYGFWVLSRYMLALSYLSCLLVWIRPFFIIILASVGVRRARIAFLKRLDKIMLNFSLLTRKLV